MMYQRRVRVTLTVAEAEALFTAAVYLLEADVDDGLGWPRREVAALSRAAVGLGDSINRTKAANEAKRVARAGGAR